ncbi:NAD(+) diphosphatase [Xanthomonas hortorum]|uniref:NAD(+) diphosphatase n=1 Tax=Xanthomonas hortorum pv. pelargonii TaxID=453602 RepID=A0A6V7BUT9_9XANT|nr:NAD(+) diphosphatase [Xanthomonas hortorum]MCE4353788.1 NAD(+) diphosphatase [Xanthomonas hortorum pv. pelargonii]MCM5522688.1 NAD(+) diphosphatase [Xanthomonas hortorum pv. pelargonii]MCM5535349.1 NAD(+) diphosphatase [Xanthomonas hortorum pv. pelargonii]MCM5538878.1 NAD(+) diphosphatase [Xanthomonas hortorum pv. pelargonii]MCM5543232.1 NAD(+) diphosphatase [Xanthomonas hortorum pv. pelargonii]
MSESLFSTSECAFTHAPLDRGDLLRDDPDALARLWPQGRVLLLDAKGAALADAQGQPLLMEGAALGDGPEAAIFLGLRDDVGWFCLPADQSGVQAPQSIDLRQAAADWPADIATAFAYARAMLHWQSRTRFCGVCGGAIAFRRAGFIAHCTQCQTEHYPRVDPAIIVAVSDGERVLLGRQASWAPGRYSVIAGFVEPGESLEQTVAREVFEETRVVVQDCRYLGAQPWPFPGALMLGFTARAAATEVPQVTGELEDARWVTHAEVTAALAGEGSIGLPPRISIARALIEHWHRTHG